ncbi:MAG: hypothetical protein KAH35_02205, partial [Candidatus Atribacteria bacterium]|nr:hypothetical protein [Candidatus Atribacteria bacterium]
MDKNIINIEHPEVHCSGNVEVIIPESSRLKIQEIQKDHKERLYLGRAYLSSIYDNTRPFDEILKFSGATLIKMSERKLRLHINWQNSGVVFTFKCNSYKMLNRVEAYAKGKLPSNALDIFKSALYTLIDRLVYSLKCPIYVQGITLLLNNKPLLYELPITFAGEKTIAFGGGFNSVHWFASLDALEREAICSPSPFYRVLCRFRIYEGIKHYLRKELRSFARKINQKAKIPKTPKITKGELQALRIKKESMSKIKTYEDVAEAFREFRNGVVRFLMEEPKGAMIMPSRGLDRSAIEKEDQILRICNQKMIEPLWDYFNKYLRDEYNRGKILVD